MDNINILIIKMIFSITGFTEQQLSEYLGVSIYSINSVLSTGKMPVGLAKRFADRFHFPISYFTQDINNTLDIYTDIYDTIKNGYYNNCNKKIDYIMNNIKINVDANDIINALIKGIDPYTKEEFDENHILKNPEVNKVLRMLAGKEIEFSNEDLDKAQLELYNALKVWRSEKYNTLHLKPYQIFTNQELIRIITHDIKKEEDLLNIKGITREKYEKFGKELFSILSNI